MSPSDGNSPKPQSFKEGLFLAVLTAVLSGFLACGPALITGLAGVGGALGAASIWQSGEAARQEREYEWQETREAKQTAIASQLAPGLLPETTPTLPPTMTPEPTGAPDQSPAELALRDYFVDINDAQYANAWDALSSNMQQNLMPTTPGDYYDFWRTAGEVSVSNITLLGYTPTDEASFEVSLYWEADRRVRTSIYNLKYSVETAAWQIESINSAVEGPPPPPR